MATMIIDPAQQHLTLIDVIEVEPARTSELIELLRGISDEVMAHQPGFVGAALHVSFDGRRVVSYVHWRSRSAWESAVARDEARARFALVARLARSIAPSLYQVVSVHLCSAIDVCNKEQP